MDNTRHRPIVDHRQRRDREIKIKDASKNLNRTELGDRDKITKTKVVDGEAYPQYQ